MISHIHPPENPARFFAWLKGESERYWGNIFQIDDDQKGGYWLPGLNDIEIDKYEKKVGFIFPEILRIFLKQMNGTNQTKIIHWGIMDEYGGEPTHIHRIGPGFYAFPRDLSIVAKRIDQACAAFGLKQKDLTKKCIPHLMPIVSNRFLVVDHCETNPILAIQGSAVTLCADSLRDFLYQFVFNKSMWRSANVDFTVKFWLQRKM